MKTTLPENDARRSIGHVRSQDVLFRSALYNTIEKVRPDLGKVGPFGFYSVLSDMCKCSYVNKKKAAMLYEVDKATGVVNMSLSGASEDDVLQRYSLVSAIISKGAYGKLIKLLKSINDWGLVAVVTNGE